MMDSQCATSQWCSMNKCVAKQANGTALPFDMVHMPPIMGCTTSSGATVCASGVCDGDIKCGYLDRTQTCTSSAVCRSGVCGTASSLCQPVGGCSLDGDCASGQYCDGTTLMCVAKLANGAATVTDSLHTGTCPALGVECASGVCDSDGKCGYANGGGTCDATNGAVVCRSGSCSGTRCGCASDTDCASTEFCLASTSTCTAKLADGAATIADALHTTSCPDRGAAECQSGTCGVGSNLCLAAGACAADSDCASTMYCNGATCVLKKTNGTATTTDAIHTGSCPALGVECVSAVCDADDVCGYAMGSGTCDATNAATVCRTGVCATTGTCGCSADTDCASNQYCSGTTRACTAKLDLGGTCNSSNAAQICESGACGSASLACIPNSGSGCWTDGDCLGTQFCKADHSCTNKLANGTAIPNDPAHGGACSAQNASAVCASGACDASDNTCGIGLEHATCASTDQCTAGVCVLTGDNAGRCEPCVSDASCTGATPACNTTTNHCVACTGASHELCTGDAPLCNTSTNACMACSADHAAVATAGSCPSANAPLCTATGACGKCTANSDCTGHARGAFCDLTTGACGAGCTTDRDCASSEWCSNPTAQPVSGTCVSKLANDDLVPSAVLVDGACTAALGQRVCASGVCDSDGRCGYANRTVCDAASECRSTVCNADGKCGDPNGTACRVNSTCRSNECAIDGTCGTRNGETCLDDAICRTGACVGGTCGLPNGQACAEPTVCRSGICFVDRACGLPNGQACHAGNDCRSGSCYQGRCEPTCELDAQCASGFYCNAAASHCDDTVPNGASCTRNAMCASGVCNADGKCGDPDGAACTWAATCRNGSCIDNACSAALDQGAPCKLDASCKSHLCADDGRCGIPSGGSCSWPSQCRDGACDATGRCAVSCASDSECAADSWCNGSCVKDGLNGAACTRDAACQSGRCRAAQCGARNGETCSSDRECRSNACDPGTHRCGYENGIGPCTAATARTACLSGVCGADHKCGLPSNGPTCASDEQCRGAACDVTRHTCNECKTDRECASNEFCGAGNCKRKLENGLGCGRANECASDVCGGDMRCGAPPVVTPATPATPSGETTPNAAPLPAPLSATAPASRAAETAATAGSSIVLIGGGGSCASTPRSQTSGATSFGLLALAVGGFLRRRRR
jgi:hypothetical protein